MVRKRMNASAFLILIGMGVLMSLVYWFETVYWFQLTLFFLVFQFLVFKLELFMRRPTYKWLVFVSLWLMTLYTVMMVILLGEWLGESLAFLSMSLISVGLLRMYIGIECYEGTHSKEIHQWMLIPLLVPLLVYGLIEVIETTEMGGWTTAGFLALIAFIAKSVSAIEKESKEDAFENTSYLAGTLYFMFLVSDPNFWTGIMGLGTLAGYILLMINEQTEKEAVKALMTVQNENGTVDTTKLIKENEKNEPHSNPINNR